MATQENKPQANVQAMHTYCAQCFSNCPVVAHIENGRFSKVTPDRDHPFFRPLCPKAYAGPELVYSDQRLEYPMKRTNPKDAADPGWERITWEEALSAIVAKMQNIKKEFGAEAFVFSQTNVSSSMWELTPFIRRLANVYGTPNHMTTTHICNWHRDQGSALTFGKPGDMFSAGWPDFERSRCVLVWGHNPKSTINAFHQHITSARKKGARIIVVDPRKTALASNADLWLQVRPGADGALALSMIHVMLEQKLYDVSFVTNWTNAPLLVRMDNGNLLRASDAGLAQSESGLFCCVEKDTRNVVPCPPGGAMRFTPDLAAEVAVRLANGNTVGCRTVFTLLKESAAPFHPDIAERHTSIKPSAVHEAVRMIAENGPSCWYAFNGVEQNMNATQTNRALCTLYALTGDYDKKGGNVAYSPLPPLDYPYGLEFVTKEMFSRNLAIKDHPLGPATSLLSVPPYLVCRSIEKGIPYQTRGLLVFGANTLSANPDSAGAAAAFQKLDFHVHIDLFMNPTAKLADIVLPAASFWETARIGYSLTFQDNQWVLHWREPVAAPRGECREIVWIVFELAKRLGFSAMFWNGNIESAFDAMLRPMGVTLRELKNADGGLYAKQATEYRKYEATGFPGLSGRVELFSQPLKEIGQSPVPVWHDPLAIFRSAGIDAARYPFLLITAKLREYCQSQHRCLPSLRKRHPHPVLEMNKHSAAQRGIADGSPVILETVHGAITLRAKPTEDVAPDVVCAQHGWWQGCPELGLPDYDIYSPAGANVNLLLNNAFLDPVSGSVHMRGFPCDVRIKR